MGTINITDFSKSYGKFLAVDNISLTVNKGEIVGFVGKNGAGKSTTIRSMLNLLFPSKGEICVDGLDSVKDAKEIKRSLSYVPSELAYPNAVTAEEIFRLCVKLSGEGFDRAEDLSEYFELDMKKKVSELSFGNRKKVSLVQAFLKNRGIIVLDEPTNGLDPLMQSKFFELLLKEKEKGATIFLSSHNLSEIEKYCDKVAIIKDGKLVDFLDMKNVKIKHKQVVTCKTKSGEEKSFSFDGDVNELVSDLAKLDLENLEIRTQSVEDEFIKYYKEDGENA